MEFKKLPPLNILFCDKCRATGASGWRRCGQCQGMAAGLSARGRWLFWNYPLTRYFLALQSGRRVLNLIRLITIGALWLNFWIWAGFAVYRQGALKLLMNFKTWDDFFAGLNSRSIFLFWLGALALLYFWYRIIKQKKIIGAVEAYEFNEKNKSEKTNGASSWPEAKKITRRRRHNLANAFTEEALDALAKAYRLADKNNNPEVGPAHLFYVLLNFNRVNNIFVRLGVSARAILKELEPLLQTKPRSVKTAGPTVTPDFFQVIFQAYEEAYRVHQKYVSVTELLIVSLRELPEAQEILFNFDISERQLANVIEWARMREKLYREYKQFRRAASHRSKYGMDKAMTALATPYLNSFSSDLTMLAHFGHLHACVARAEEVAEVYRVVEGGQNSVILVGERGVGKRSIIEGIAQNMVAEDVLNALKDKRLVSLSVSALLAGSSPAGAIERLCHIMQEISRARNVILFINDIHELIGVSAGASGSLDVAGTLAEFLGSGRFLTLATTTAEDYNEHILNSGIKNVFAKVAINEMSQDQAVQVLESRAGSLEYKQNVFFSYDAVEKCVEYAVKFAQDSPLPGSALELMTEAASFARNKKGLHALVTKEEVASIVTAKTKIPLSAISSDESGKLLLLEEAMRQRVVGQDEAVGAVANALRRARAEMRSTKRPIANFLFLGPTGVGKTELAKTIADIYFGGEDKIIRLDMSEYQDKNSIDRLIGLPGEKAGGLLTNAVRSHPFSLVLLDEIEKANPDVLNLFLQVMDDGRLSDSAGHAFNFTNTIIIATSNAGTAFVQEQIASGAGHEEILNKLLHGELKNYFRPEFLNRFDGIILFNALSHADIKKIAGLMLAGIAKDLEQKAVRLEISDTALDFFADVGFDPEFGARLMRRTLQEKVENKLAELFLRGELKRGATVMLGAGGDIAVL